MTVNWWCATGGCNRFTATRAGTFTLVAANIVVQFRTEPVSGAGTQQWGWRHGMDET